MAKVQNESTKNDPVLTAIPAACCEEKASVEFMETQRWGDSPCCPRCASVDVYQMKDSKTGERQANWRWLCRDCKRAKLVCQFTVRTGTVFEDSKCELRHWCFAFWRAATSKKGVSALELHRQTGLSYKTCLFMLNRIRYAMADNGAAILGPNGGDVEVDETYIGGKPRYQPGVKHKAGRGTKKIPVAAILERGGSVRVRPVADINAANLKQFVIANVDRSARILSDESTSYKGIGAHFDRGHETVNHGIKEYARGDVHSNSIEGFFGLVKRGINGIYHNVSKEHLHRYLAEFEYRFNNRELTDGQRTAKAIRSAQGKRLVYKSGIEVK